MLVMSKPSHSMDDPRMACDGSGRLNGNRVEMELVVTRAAAELLPPKQTYAKLFVGCANDDQILLYEHVVLESFPSPYKVTPLE